MYVDLNLNKTHKFLAILKMDSLYSLLLKFKFNLFLNNTEGWLEVHISLIPPIKKSIKARSIYIYLHSSTPQCLLYKKFLCKGKSKLKFQETCRYQKQPSRGKKCSENKPQIYRRTTMPKCNFNKVAKQLY